MNVFMATLSTETNTFSPIPTGLADFQHHDFHRNDGSRHPPVKSNTALIVWRGLAEGDGHVVHEGVCTSAQPGGTTTRHAYETLRGLLLDDLRTAGPVELILLSLHGARGRGQGLSVRPCRGGNGAAGQDRAEGGTGLDRLGFDPGAPGIAEAAGGGGLERVLHHRGGAGVRRPGVQLPSNCKV